MNLFQGIAIFQFIVPFVDRFPTSLTAGSFPNTKEAKGDGVEVQNGDRTDNLSVRCAVCNTYTTKSHKPIPRQLKKQGGVPKSGIHDLGYGC